MIEGRWREFNEGKKETTERSNIINFRKRSRMEDFGNKIEEIFLVTKEKLSIFAKANIWQIINGVFCWFIVCGFLNTLEKTSLGLLGHESFVTVKMLMIFSIIVLLFLEKSVRGRIEVTALMICTLPFLRNVLVMFVIFCVLLSVFIETKLWESFAEQKEQEQEKAKKEQKKE